jgi:hypothetical protein
VRSLPFHEASLPSGGREVLSLLPERTPALPERVAEVPEQTCALPVGAGGLPEAFPAPPVRVGEAPARICASPVRICASPVRVSESPAPVREAPVRICAPPAAIFEAPDRIDGLPEPDPQAPERSGVIPERTGARSEEIRAAPDRGRAAPDLSGNGRGMLSKLGRYGDPVPLGNRRYHGGIIFHGQRKVKQGRHSLLQFFSERDLPILSASPSPMPRRPGPKISRRKFARFVKKGGVCGNLYIETPGGSSSFSHLNEWRRGKWFFVLAPGAYRV